MKIAVVGSGISGMVAARELHHEHEVSVFEAADWIGGHTNTVEVESPEGTLAVDTGFIVFNQETYPEFCRLLKQLGVAWQASDMSFSVRCDESGLEYNGTSLDGLLARRSNALRPSFWRMVRDILRFYREAPAVLAQPDDGTTLGQFLERGGYSSVFVEKHLIPMGSAVWSSRPERMRQFPLRFLLQFFHNHGFLRVEDRPQWLVVRGGSREYVRKLVAPFRGRIHLKTPIVAVERTPSGTRLRTAAGEESVFDKVVLATHADTSLRLLVDARPLERELLSSFEYQRNEAVLHTDASLMPRRPRAWASWNYHIGRPSIDLPTVTYWMNRLQGLPGARQYFLTLNRGAEIAPESVERRIVYQHPIYSAAAVRAQARHAQIDGQDSLHFVGAYWGWGFHEDGVKSALASIGRLKARVNA